MFMCTYTTEKCTYARTHMHMHACRHAFMKICTHGTTLCALEVGHDDHTKLFC